MQNKEKGLVLPYVPLSLSSSRSAAPGLLRVYDIPRSAECRPKQEMLR